MANSKNGFYLVCVQFCWVVLSGTMASCLGTWQHQCWPRVFSLLSRLISNRTWTQHSLSPRACLSSIPTLGSATSDAWGPWSQEVVQLLLPLLCTDVKWRWVPPASVPSLQHTGCSRTVFFASPAVLNCAHEDPRTSVSPWNMFRCKYLEVHF